MCHLYEQHSPEGQFNGELHIYETRSNRVFASPSSFSGNAQTFYSLFPRASNTTREWHTATESSSRNVNHPILSAASFWASIACNIAVNAKHRFALSRYAFVQINHCRSVLLPRVSYLRAEARRPTAKILQTNL